METTDEHISETIAPKEEQLTVKSMPTLVANWQPKETVSSFLTDLKTQLFTSSQFFLALPYSSLQESITSFSSLGISFGLPYLHCINEDSFTKSIAISYAKELQASFIILRSPFELSIQTETFIETKEKLNKILSTDLIVFLCLGEEDDSNPQDLVETQLREQFNSLLSEKSQIKPNQLYFVYHPLWWTRHQRKIALNDVRSGCVFLRKIINEHFGDDVGENIKILSGHVQDMDDISPLQEEGIINGLYVDRASGLSLHPLLKLTEGEQHA